MTFSACPACSAAPAASALARVPDTPATVTLSLPTIHCAACMTKVERALEAVPGVASARVNLTLKRVQISAARGVLPEALVQTVLDAGYEAHELNETALNQTARDRAGRALLMRLAVAGFAMMNVMLLSVAVWSGAEGATRDLFHWVSAAIVLPAVAFSAQPFFANAWAALRARSLTMDVPISLAILLAVATSLWETSLSGEHAYFDAAIALTFFLLAGRYLDHRTRSAARSAAQELAALEVPRAALVTVGGDAQVAVADLAVGDVIRVRPGERFAVDGVITEGQSEVDLSALTGESVPVRAKPGQSVSAGSVNLTGPLLVRASAVGQDTALHRMADLVAVAEAGRSRYTALADRAARLYAPGVHILSALSFLGWLAYAGDLRMALNIAAAVLIITCPCALGLAVPAVTTAAAGRLFRKGLLVKDATALERLAQVDTVVFDKTGTLTEGAPELANPSGLPPEAMAVALALAEGSAHPLSRAVVKAARRAGHAPAKVTQLVEVPGCGTEALYQGQTVRFGRGDWVGAHPADMTADVTEAWLRVGANPPIAFQFEDHLRDGAQDAVAALRAAGLEVRLLSGDAPKPVAALAARLGIPQWQAAARPEDKARVLAELAAEGRHALMLGDGLNDAAALRAAYVSISPAQALDAARVASDIVLLGKSLAPLPEALALARTARRRITQNFTLATWYNLLAVPLAVAGLCSPLIAALAMSSSSLTVSLNALRLRS